MLDVRNLSKLFSIRNGSPVLALDSVNFSTRTGACVYLLGPNGSGKTTFLKILAGLILPDSGQITAVGHDVLAETRRVQEKTGFSPADDRSFYGRLSGFENLRFFGGLRGMGTQAIRDRLAALETTLRLSELLEIPYQKTSSGMKQRLSLARAMLHQPQLLLLDEPAQRLDPSMSKAVRDYIRNEFLVLPNRLAICSAQQPNEAWETATFIVILRGGRIAAYGTPENLMQEAKASSPEQAYQFWTKSHDGV